VSHLRRYLLVTHEDTYCCILVASLFLKTHNQSCVSIWPYQRSQRGNFLSVISRGNTSSQMVTIPLITFITAYYRMRRMTNIAVKTLKIIAIHLRFTHRAVIS